MIDEITSKINLPIQYSGTIRNYKDALQLISLGVDKVVLRSLFDIKHQDEILKITDELSKNFSSKIKLNYKHDESLIGGLIVQVGSTMVDTSIKNKLQQIENKMIEA